VRRASPLFSALIVLAVIAQAGPVAGAESVGQPYIVVLDEEAVGQPGPGAAKKSDGLTAKQRIGRKIDAEKVARRVTDLEKSLKFKAKNVYDSALGGFSADLTPGQLRKLQSDPAVAFVAPDEKTSLPDDLAAEDGIAAIRTTTSTAVRTPAGIVRVGATRNSIANIDGVDDRVNADVAILDTGVDSSHPDLNLAGGYNCTTSSRAAWGDQHGHGTHVAGTVAAKDNGIGVVGVAPGARIWSVKVLNSQGTGYLSWLVCGIDWVTGQRDAAAPSGQRIEVANMSLRFTNSSGNSDACGVSTKDSLHQAICRSVRAGVVYAVAAGNDKRNAKWYRPAAYPEAITVSAIADYDGKPGGLARQADYCGFYSSDGDDTFADFSNYGAVVNLTAPGKCVVSTYPGKRYAWMSGTSMATPHVAGGAALYMVRYPQATPGQVLAALQNGGLLDWRTATDPDSKHEKLLWLASNSAPPSFELSASSPAGWVASGSKVPVIISRTNGHNAKINLSLTDAPAGLTGSGSVTGAGGQLTLQTQSSTPSGTHRVTVRATDGALVITRRIDLKLDNARPSVYFASPAAGTTVQSANSVPVSWHESDAGGSGIAGRTLQRQRAAIKTAGTCAGVSWSDIGSPVTEAGNIVQTLNSNYCFRWRLAVRDSAGNSTSILSGSVLIGGSTGGETLVGPQVNAPVYQLLPASKVKPDRLVRVETSWSASAPSGVTAHRLRVSSNGGSTWAAVSLADATKARAVVLLNPGSSYLFSARSRDGQGAWSPWVNSSSFSLAMTQAESKGVSYSGTWSTASISSTLGGKVRHSKQRNARATFSFSGRQVAIVSLTRATRGKAEVYVDGRLQTTVNLRSTTVAKRKVVFTRSWNKSSTHKLEVRVLATSGRPRVDLDAFVVLR
jgi:subtilisin